MAERARVSEVKRYAETLNQHLTAYAFGDNWVAWRDEDGSSGLARHAVVVHWRGWYVIFREHGSPEYIPDEPECYAVMLKPVQGKKAYTEEDMMDRQAAARRKHEAKTAK